MTHLGQSGILLAMVLSAGVPAFAVVPNSSCRATVSTTPSASAKADCAQAQSRGVVYVAELRKEVADLKLSSQQVQELVVSARTRTEHLRLAGYYNVRAESDLAQARDQQQMAIDYSASPVASSDKFAAGTVKHCVAIIHRLRQHAAKMRELQKEQEQLASQSGE